MFSPSWLAANVVSGSFLRHGHLTFTIGRLYFCFALSLFFIWTKPEDRLVVKSGILRGFLRYS